MSEGHEEIALSEWDRHSPDTRPALRGRYLEESTSCRNVVDTLNKSKMLRITELRHGIEVRSKSYVGRVRVGDLTVIVRPNLNTPTLLSLLRYAYGLRRLKLLSETQHQADQLGFEDLLISQLNAEAEDLISRGLMRSYVRRDDRLGSPRGKIDIGRLVLDGGTITATLPCQHHPRIEDTIQNRVLMAGLHLAGSLASFRELRRESRRLATLMAEQVSPIRLDSHAMERLARKSNRLTAAYNSAFTLIGLLLGAQGIVFDGQRTATPLPGFLFDMTRFFQMLLSRFLRENLLDCNVKDEHGLRKMMQYRKGYRLNASNSPTPRPDFAVLRQGKLVTLLDAKYRDLWDKGLPRDMLYQLVVYAISQPDRPQSTILYPSANPNAKVATLDIADPLHGRPVGCVHLRPICLETLERLVRDDSASNRRQRIQYASALAFG